MIYEYENLKTNEKIKVDISKRYSFIYGPKGTGKTTFARSIENNKYIIHLIMVIKLILRIEED